MKHDLASMTALLAIAGGAQTAHEYLAGEGRRQTASVNTGDSDYDVLNLPVPKDAEDRDYFVKKFGFVFLPVEGRNLTTKVYVPKGWRVVPTTHWLWHDLLDAQGQKRGTIMLHYQDHDADLNRVLKYTAGVWQQEYGPDFPAHPAIHDSNGKLLWLGPAVPVDKEPHAAAHKRHWDQFHALPEAERTWEARTAWKEKEPKSAYDIARAAAVDRRRHYAPKNDLKLKGWDVYFDKPVSDWGAGIEEPKLTNFRLHVTYYHLSSGSYADSGSDVLRAVNTKQAIKLAKKRLSGGTGYRRVVKLTVDGTSENVWEFADPQTRIDSYDVYGDFGCCITSSASFRGGRRVRR